MFPRVLLLGICFCDEGYYEENFECKCNLVNISQLVPILAEPAVVL
jgi:hypothetical protein